MADQQTVENQQTLANEVSDETGQFDPRFLLWRQFCVDQGIAVNNLPSDLSGETKKQWERLKEAQCNPR